MECTIPYTYTLYVFIPPQALQHLESDAHAAAAVVNAAPYTLLRLIYFVAVALRELRAGPALGVCSGNRALRNWVQPRSYPQEG